MRRLAALALALLVAACSAPAPSGHGRIERFERIELAAGSGAEARPGDRLTVHYTGWLFDDRVADGRGAVFDDSHRRGEPIRFVLGARQVIRGWDEGLTGLRVGGRGLLRLPPDYAYGARGAGRAIGPEASLLFEVELLAVDPT